MDQAHTAFLESRLNELEAENASLRSMLKTYQEIAVSVETKNCELRQKLRLLGHPVEPFDEALPSRSTFKRQTFTEDYMAAAIGNDYSKKSNRLWGDTLRRIAAQDPDKLRKIAEALYQKAAEGDIQAAKEIGDRLDGKAAQSLAVTGENGGPVQFEEVKRTVVDARDSDA